MALNTLKCNYLMSLRFKGLKVKGQDTRCSNRVLLYASETWTLLKSGARFTKNSMEGAVAD